MSNLDVGVLAQEYGLTDANGARPAPFRMPEKK